VQRLEQRPAGDPDVAAVLARWGMTRAVRRGELVDVTAHPALVIGRPPDAVLVYIPGEVRWEVIALFADVRRRGLGTALIEAVAELARAAGAQALQVTTTNDNVDALRFYQRRGFALAELRAGAVDRGRAELKPEIPVVGDHGIPLRDELELARPLNPAASG
jgi:GNAT superfamily N-acetyltransferase